MSKLMFFQIPIFLNMFTTKRTILLLMLSGALSATTANAQDLQSLDALKPLPKATVKNTDWLVSSTKANAGVYRSADNRSIILSNGLIQRSFRLAPDFACYDFPNLTNGQQLIRAIKPEASISINNKVYSVGGLQGQK